MSVGDKVLLFLTVGALVIGGLSMLVGWVADRVPVKSNDDSAPVAPKTIMSNDASIKPGITVSIPSNTTFAQQPALRDLTEREGVQWLARRKKADSWALSANQIYNLVGGNRNVVMGWISEARQEQQSSAEEYETPIAGRRTNARYYAGTDLEYQPPNA